MNLRAVIAVLALTFSNGAGADFTFALLGDTPYGSSEEASFADMLQEINHSDVAFVVHVGDFKSGLTSCGDAVFAQRHAMFEASRHAFIYIPGDNEWTDCHRLFAGGYDPLERLAALRTRFFNNGASLGQTPLRLSRQSDDAAAPRYPEHLRWQHEGVLFVTLNFPGGDNNSRMPQEAAERTAAALAWLQQTFAQAPISHPHPLARPNLLHGLQDRRPSQHQVSPISTDTGLGGALGVGDTQQAGDGGLAIAPGQPHAIDDVSVIAWQVEVQPG